MWRMSCVRLWRPSVRCSSWRLPTRTRTWPAGERSARTSSAPADSKSACSRHVSPSPAARAEPQRCEPVDLAAITADALEAHDLSELESVVALDTARTSGDPNLVERLVANLVANAVRHNIPGGRLDIVTYTAGGTRHLARSRTPARDPGRRSSRVSSNRFSGSPPTQTVLPTGSGSDSRSCSRSPTHTTHS